MQRDRATGRASRFDLSYKDSVLWRLCPYRTPICQAPNGERG
jgi:hypothetical protein